ncbi:MAG: 5-(carboxyamino)imidazole ribonucleotide synthase [Armatimonadota bacterium]|nr:5-(carboxyamino)imidazole ribonucleotide synthase [Armatimonadota bacterium]
MKIGVLGGGQLGRMLGLAGIPLGHEFVFFDDGEKPCAGEVGEVRPLSPLGKVDDLDVLTYEFENVFEAVDRASRSRVVVAPSRRAIEISSDRLVEKDFFTSLKIPTARYRPFSEADEFDGIIDEIGYPCIAKTRRFGYDGKGQMRLDGPQDRAACLAMAGEKPMVLEALVPFVRELSQICARAADGEKVFYPLVENSHHEGILRMTIAPAPDLKPGMQSEAEEMVGRLADELDYVGTLAVELFQIHDELMANEIAPRVHNSGHWTIEGAETSQFENHIRAITGAPLGSAKPRGQSAMINLIGVRPNPDVVLQVPGSHFHWYGKEVRAGRKVGHVTLRADDPADLGRNLAMATAMLAP